MFHVKHDELSETNCTCLIFCARIRAIIIRIPRITPGVKGVVTRASKYVDLTCKKHALMNFVRQIGPKKNDRNVGH